VVKQPEKIGLFRCNYCGRYKINEHVCDYCDTCNHDLAYYIQVGIKSLIVIILLTAATSASLSNGITAYYTYDNTLEDSTPSSRNMTNFGATYTASGKINGAYSFDGVNDYMTSVLGSNPSNYSIGFWVKINGSTGNDFIYSNWLTSGAYSWLYTNGSTITYSRWNAVTENMLTYALPSPTTFNHIVIVDTPAANSIVLYVNGVQVNSTTNAGGNAQNQVTWNFGRRAASDYANIVLDEIAFYANRSLNSSDVNTLYNYGNSGLQYPFIEPSFFSVFANSSSGAAINNFNITVLPQNFFYSTANGTINTNLSRGFLYNISVSSSGYITINYNNYDNTNDLYATLPPIEYFGIEVRDVFNNQLIPVSSADIDSSTYSTTNGNIITDIIRYFNTSKDVTVYADYYVPQTFINYNTGSNLSVNMSAYNASQLSQFINLSLNVFGEIIVNLNNYFANSLYYTGEVYNTVNDTIPLIINDNVSFQNTYFNVSINNNLLRINSFEGESGISIRIYGYNINGLNVSGNRFDVLSTQSVNEGLGFSFDTSDARFWVFVVLSVSLVLLSLFYSGNYIGYIAGIFFFYYGIQFLLVDDMPMLYGLVFFCLSIILVYRELISGD
jgi:hypothetical protein